MSGGRANERHRLFRTEDLDKVPIAQTTSEAHPLLALPAADDPLLAELWDNETDAVYDKV